MLQQTKPFALSIGSKSALVLLSNLDDNIFHLHSQPEPELMWSFRVFYQLRGISLPANDQAAWTECQGLLQDKSSLRISYSAQQLQKIFTEELVFTDENIDSVERLLQGQEGKIDPAIYSDSSALTGILMFPIKDAVIYCGLLPEKGTPWRRYQRLLHKAQDLQGNS